MSRSRRKTPKCKWYFDAKRSEKWWKQMWHRQLRSHNRIHPHLIDVENFLLHDHREFCADWELGNTLKRRFDPREHPQLMRK